MQIYRKIRGATTSLSRKPREFSSGRTLQKVRKCGLEGAEMQARRQFRSFFYIFFYDVK